MFDSRNRTIDPRFGVKLPSSTGRHTEPAKRFRFAITWKSLTSHLELSETSKWTSSTAKQPAPEMKEASLAAWAGMALQPLSTPETQPDPKARWEMVVPKMVRSGSGSKASATTPISGNPNRAYYPPVPIPASTGLENTRMPLLAKAFAVIERRTRSLLAGPSKPIDATPISFLDPRQRTVANGRSGRLEVLQLNAPTVPIPPQNQIASFAEVQDRHELREMLLSKITSTLLSRSGRVDPRLAKNAQEERWSKASHSA